MSTTTVPLPHGVQLVVPDTLHLITPYVLMEQEDWFEEEIRFLRQLLRPGQRVIDIGANHGVYTLSMAHTVGATGHVLAFEPASGTADFLRRSVALNGFRHVTVEQAALSSNAGTAQLRLETHSECNALVHGDTDGGPTETVPVLTLDDAMAAGQWAPVDLLKMDAEGEELRILEGGRRFFADMSPLVMYEARTETELQAGLVRALAAMGYRSYRLVPGLGVLVPFDLAEPHDEFLLNLFACKPDQAAALQARELLLTDHGNPAKADLDTLAQARPWRQTLGGLPYGAALAAPWEDTVRSGRGSAEVIEALALYAASRDAALPMALRWGALRASLAALDAVCAADASFLRLSSLARVARDLGARAKAVQALHQLAATLIEQRRLDLGEPFLAVSERFDTIAPGQAWGNWVLAGALEELERQSAFSSFYTGAQALDRLRAIASLGFGGPDMLRRLKMVQLRMGLPL